MLYDQYGKPLRMDSRQTESLQAVRRHYEGQFRQLKASYDAVRDGAAFAKHWSNADNLSPNSANSASIRRKLRSRARFECIENNPYLKGTLLSMANDFVGSGPKLQVTDPDVPDSEKQFVEREYSAWMAETRYRSKLWQGRMAKCGDGESFKQDYHDPKLPTPVKLNQFIFEADQCTSEGYGQQAFDTLTVSEIDGIKVDRFNNPLAYFILDTHPGANNALLKTLNGRWYLARHITHWYRKERNWNRGIPEITPSLPLCALLRRYTLAVVKACELNAAYALALQTEMPPNTTQWAADANDDPDDGAFDEIPFEHGSFTVLPFGAKLAQMKAEQPVATYDSFVFAVLREIVRPLLTPFMLASGSSQEATMSAAVVDTHIYKGAQAAERTDCQEVDLTVTFRKWLIEAKSVPNYLPQMTYQKGLTLAHSWRWDPVGLEHTDPEKVANARKVAQEMGHITDRDIQELYYNRSVEDWQEDMRRQQAFRKTIDLPVRAPKGADGVKAGPSAPSKVRASLVGNGHAH